MSLKKKVKKKEIISPLLSQSESIDVQSKYYGKYIIYKGFNDNTVITFSDAPEKAIEKAEKKGYRVYSKSGEYPTGILWYCFAPCERFIGSSIYIKGEVFDSCLVNPQCPKCKYLKK